MPQKDVLKCVGLYTFPNELSALPDGALVVADNVVIDRDGVVSPRRGFALYGPALTGGGTRAKQLLVYKGRIFRHYNTTLDFDSVGDGSNFFVHSTSITEPGLKLRGIEANGNLYFTTSSGIKKLSAAVATDLSTAVITDAGGIKALDGFAALNSQPGFFIQNSAVAYRILWGIKDANNNLVSGAPSERIVISNSMLSLIVGDFNGMITKLATASNGTGTGSGAPLSDSDYSSLKLGSNASANVVYTALVGLCQKLDTDLGTNNYYGKQVNIASSTINFQTTIATSTAHGLLPGDTVKIIGHNSTPSIDGSYAVLTAADSTHFTIQANVTTAGGAFGTVYKTNVPYRRYMTPPIDPATTGELVNLQAFYDNVVNALLVEPSANIATQPGFANSTQSATVNLTFTIPPSVTVNHLYQVYRSSQATSTGTTRLSDMAPSDELQLCYEGNPTSAQITAKSITIQDITPDSFLGANLYSNENSGEGAAQVNEIPPLAQDIAFYKGSSFFANTSTRHRKIFSLLAATGLTNQTLSITGATTNTYTFIDTVKTTNITCIAGNLFNAVTAEYFDIYSANNELHYRVWFNVGGSMAAPAVTAGVKNLGVTVLTTDSAAAVATKLATALASVPEFYCTVASNVVSCINNTPGTSNAPVVSVANVGFTVAVPSGKDGSGENAGTKTVGISNAQTPAQAVDDTARSLVRIINQQAGENVYAYYLSGENDVPGSILLEARTLGTSSFSIAVGNSAIGAKFNPTLPTSGTTVSSDNEVKPNRVYYSKYQQPEAVPLLNYLDIGPKDNNVLRIITLRDSLFAITVGGVYRISGNNAQFSVYLLDSSTVCRGPDTAAALNNNIYMLSNQGVVKISETGVQVISRPIEDLLLPLFTPSFTGFNQSFATGYESDRSYLLFTVTNPADTTPTQCFRYNTFTNSWVRWPVTKTCAVVNPADDKLYVGAGDTNYIEQERKSFTRLDHADREQVVTIPALGVTDTTVALGNLFGINPGDVMVQTQYLTVAQFNRVLAKLDSNAHTVHNYMSNLQALPGGDLRGAVTLLATQLDADAGASKTDGTTPWTYSAIVSGFASDFVNTQLAFNALVNKLNIDNGIRDNKFLLSNGTVTWEVPVASTDAITKKITTVDATPFINGPLSVFSNIDSKVAWAPQHFGDPSLTKHVREATIMFNNNAFSSATASYASDLSTGFTDIPFSGEGSGTWGSFDWGQATFGGEGTGKPLRTLIPRDKQRCRLITCQFEHGVAFEHFDIFGISFTYEAVSSRGYR